MKKTTSTLLAAAVSGLFLGSTISMTSCKGGPETANTAASMAKHACKGMNACKGQGSLRGISIAMSTGIDRG